MELCDMIWCRCCVEKRGREGGDFGSILKIMRKWQVFKCQQSWFRVGRVVTVVLQVIFQPGSCWWRIGDFGKQSRKPQKKTHCSYCLSQSGALYLSMSDTPYLTSQRYWKTHNEEKYSVEVEKHHMHHIYRVSQLHSYPPNYHFASSAVLQFFIHCCDNLKHKNASFFFCSRFHCFVSSFALPPILRPNRHYTYSQITTTPKPLIQRIKPHNTNNIPVYLIDYYSAAQFAQYSPLKTTQKKTTNKTQLITTRLLRCFTQWYQAWSPPSIKH